MRLALALAALVLAALGVASASAELTQKGDVFVRFDGGIAPKALPRTTTAPISVRIEGRIRVLTGQQPPALRQITVALNREGRLSTAGLPLCRRSQIDPANPAEALAACGPALVGSGGIVARSSLPNQANPLLRGNVLLFNGRSRGRPTILAQVYQRAPPTTYVIEFSIRRTSGTFGTTISGAIPPSVNRNGYLESIFLRLGRSYSYRGRQHAYLSASCAAPAGFTAAIFPFARASMGFADGRSLTSTLLRTCRVRG
ncbi:MAG: hypothetical protein H0X42_12400 [Solirubrobacterales bacterium]|nr:hypothetical protein [Solirubrobacterales bacterium]